MNKLITKLKLFVIYALHAVGKLSTCMDKIIKKLTKYIVQLDLIFNIYSLK